MRQAKQEVRQALQSDEDMQNIRKDELILTGQRNEDKQKLIMRDEAGPAERREGCRMRAE
jgi:hypothetical protein